MAADLGDVVKFCNGLTSEKQTERKTSANRLIERLKDPEIQTAIDESGKARSKSRVSWDAILNAVFGYVLNESDILKGSSKLTDDTLSRKKKDISETFRTAIQLAEKRGPVLKAGNVFNHIWCIMNNHTTQKWFCNEYTNVLVKNFLSVEAHRCQITPKIWHDLIHIYCSCIMKPPPKGDTSIFAQALHLLTALAGSLSNVRGNDLFKFFGEVFKDIRDYKNETYVSYLLSALNSFSIHFAADNRVQLCILGEDLFPMLLPLWNKTSTLVKGKLIDFFRIQVDIHHPCGAHLEEHGAWSSNEEFWKKCLTKLHEAISTEFQQFAGKIKWSGKADIAQKSNFIELAVGTYHQIFFIRKQREDDIEISAENGASRKRQKIESNWQPVIDGILMVSSPTACIAWLQFFTAFINKHAASFPFSEYLPFMTCLHQAMVHCKRPDILGFIIRALQSLADKANIINGGKYCDMKEIDTSWRNIWFETLKAIHSRNIDECGFILLTTILQAGLYTPSKDAYNIFFSSGMRISRDSLWFLLHLLQRYPVPDKPSSNIDICSDYEKSAKYLARRKIIELVLPDLDVSTGRKNFLKNFSEMTKGSTLASALVIACALQKGKVNFSEKIENLCRSESNDLLDCYEIKQKKIEELYMKSSFLKTHSDVKREEQTKLKSNRWHRVGLIPELCLFVAQRCATLKDTIVNLHRDEEFRKASSYLCDWLEIICKYLPIFKSTVFMLMCIPESSFDQLKIGLMETVRALINTASSILPRLFNDSNIEEDARDNSVLNLIISLNEFFHMIHTVKSSQDEFLALFPKSFMELLFSITLGQLYQSSKQASRFPTTDFGSSSSSSTTIGDFDDMMETSDRTYTQRQLSNQGQNRVSQDDTTDSSISKSESIRVEASKLLCIFAFVPDPLHHINERSLKDSILDFLDDKFDTRKIISFHILKAVIDHLTSYSIALSPADQGVLFECIRQYISDHRSSQSACEEGLALLHPMIQFLKASAQQDEEHFAQVRCIAMKVISALWTLREEKYCPEVRLMLLKCMVEVLQVDPKGVWSKIELSKQSKKGQNKSELSTIEACLLQLITDKSHMVRMKAAEYVRILFRSSDDLPIAPEQQQSTFNKVADALTELILIKDNLTDYEIDDLSANRAASLLYVLKVVACSSSVCEKKAIALLFQDYKEKFLGMKLVGKVFREIALDKGFKDATEYLKEHIGFLCNDWMKRGFPIVEFPSSVVQMDIKEFLRYYSREIIPYVMLYRDQTGFDKIKDKLELQDPWTDLIINNFDRIIVFLLPFHACQSKTLQGPDDEGSFQENEIERKKAKMAYEFLENTLTKEVIDKLLVKRFDDIVVELFLRMFDPPSEDSDASQFMRDTDAAPNLPYFTSFAVRGTLEYLASCHRNKSVLEVLSLKKDSIQKILLALATSITSSKTEREKVRLLCSYRLFVLLLLDDLQNGLGLNWAYFIRDVIYRCCHWLNWYFHNGSDNAFFLCVYHVLQKVTEISLISCCEEFGCHIVIIVNTLTKFGKRGGDQGRKALSLLKFIVIDHCEAIRTFLVDLPPFPETLEFSDLSKRLEILKEEHDVRDSFDDLQILYQQEFISVEVLTNFFQILKRDKSFIQRSLDLKSDGTTAVLELISRLLELASLFDKFPGKDPDREMRLAIGKCIGEIGPIDFHSFALPTPEGKVSKEDEEFFGSNKTAFYYHLVLDRLCSLLTHENMEVVSAAATALKDALHTKSGIQYLNVYDAGNAEKPKFFLYSQPFKPLKGKKGSQHSQDSQQIKRPSVDEFIAFAGGTRLWEPGLMTYDGWIKVLSSTLILSGSVHDEILIRTGAVCKLDVSFASMAFPLLIHNILLNCNDEFKTMLSSLVNRFISQYNTKRNIPLITQAKAHISQQKSSQMDDKEKAARTIINAVNYLRKQDKPLQSVRAVNTKWDNNFWLDIKYLDLAQMAFECSSYFAAVMFTEIWCDIQRFNSTNLFETEESCVSSQGTQLESLSDESGSSEVKISCQRLLFEAYRCIGEPDAVYGVGTGYSSDVTTRVKAYEYEAEFGKALLTQDLQKDVQRTSGSLALAQNLERAGLNQVLLTYMNGVDKNFIDDKDAFEELQYEACWRNGVWDLETHSRSAFEETTSFSGAIFNSIVALKEGDVHVFECLIDEARISLLTSNGIEGNVSTSSLYDFLSKMNAITVLEAYGKEYFSKELLPTSTSRVLPNDFKYYELSLSVKAAALKATLHRESQKSNGDTSIKDDIAREAYSHLLRSAVLAREAGRFQVCERHLHDISNLEAIADVSFDWKIEQAKMFWDRGEKNRAMYHLKSLIKNCEKGKDPRITDLYPAALGIYGHWLAETRSENPGIIIENYMEHAACLLEDSQCTLSETPSEAYYLLAKYADSQYEGIKEYIQSSAFENKQTVIKKVKEEINRLNETGNANTSSRYYRSLSLQCEEDEKELQRMLKDRKQFLQKAIENYVRCLCSGDKYDLRIFRLCSLWLENSHEVSVNQIFKTCVTKMESRKFIPLMYQLAARLGSGQSKENKMFSEILEQLVEKAAREHPFHVTVIIMALCNVEIQASGETQSSTTTSRRSKLSRKDASAKTNGNDQNRIQSAKSILAKLKQANPSLIESMEIVMAAYMELAYHDIQHLKRQTGKFELPSKLLLRKLKDVKNFAVPTLEIPVDPSCKYQNVTYIASFDNTFTHCGGVNLPKVITCIGSDGKRRKQLVKGKDDLRQDAVMQQVFGMVNQLLKENAETRKRELRIRTYKVVPLSQRSGIVEWCENTVPLGEYLIGVRGIGGAHSRYYPTDWTAAECRKRITDAANSNGKKSRFTVFQDIVRNFRPVFRHFFYEKFTDPAEWFTKRLAYTRSLASSSIVGYVVGLGDRHVQNILIDFITAELVHIDLGIAFEQGKQLPTPETIPFRLTRDLVDGMGAAGVEGVFRRCCEKVMGLMRNSQEAILTIVEVLLYDPLYAWTLSPLKAVQVQEKTTDYGCDTLHNMSANADGNLGNLLEELQSVQPQADHSKNKMAQRVLIRLKQKLDGNEAGSVLSTEGQVNFLIQAARDPKNLCRVFPGWQPWI